MLIELYAGWFDHNPRSKFTDNGTFYPIHLNYLKYKIFTLKTNVVYGLNPTFSEQFF